MAFAINPVFPVIAAQGASADIPLKPGTTISAQVLQQVDANRVRIAIPNLILEVLSEVPLQPGQILQLAVSQTPQGVRLQIVPQSDGAAVAANAAAAASANADATLLDILGAAKPAPPPSPSSTNALVTTATDATLLDILGAPAKAGASTTAGAAPSATADTVLQDVAGTVKVEVPTAAAAAGRPLTNLEALAVSAAVQTAAAKQGSLAPLFANLSAAMASGTLPQTLQQAAAQLLALRPKLTENLSGEDLKTAFRNSGLFLEQSMPNGGAMPNGAASQSMAGLPDMKAALIVFRQTLASWLENPPVQETQSPSQQGQNASQSATAQKPGSQNTASQNTASPNTASQGATSQGASISGCDISRRGTSDCGVAGQVDADDIRKSGAGA